MTEVYFLFYEELDWSLLIQNAGYETWYEPMAIVWHKESMTKGSPLRLYYMTRARLLFARRNYSGNFKLLSCIYLSTIVLLKNTLILVFKKDLKLLSGGELGVDCVHHQKRHESLMCLI